MTWEKVPPPSKYQTISASSIENHQEMMDYFDNMTEEEAREYMQQILDTMTFEEQAEFLRELGGTGEDEQ
jgi:hypothetical protein